MASDREKWINYAHSCISGTHGTHAVDPGRAPSLDNPSEKWNRTFAYHLKGYKFCLIGLLWIFRCRYLLKISNVIKRRNGSFEKLHCTSASRRLFLSSDLKKMGPGGDRRIFLGLKFSIPVFFGLEKFWFTWGFFGTQNILKLSFCVMLLMKQKMFLGVSSVSWVFWGFIVTNPMEFFQGGRGLIFVHIRASP